MEMCSRACRGLQLGPGTGQEWMLGSLPLVQVATVILGGDLCVHTASQRVYTEYPPHLPHTQLPKSMHTTGQRGL